MADTIQFPGKVEWAGENPGISLKESPEGPFVSLASFFRVVQSSFGRGHALVLMQSPHDAKPKKGLENYVFYDNEKLARFLVEDFCSHFGAFKGIAGLKSLVYRRLDTVESQGNAIDSYRETVNAGDLTIRLEWKGLGEPFCFAFPPEKSATGKHYMPSTFVGCKEATISVDGRMLPGKPVPREIAGHTISTAMLAFSETWIKA